MAETGNRNGPKPAVYSYCEVGTFLSEHDPVGLAASVPRLEGEVEQVESESRGRSVDLQATLAVGIWWGDVRVARRDHVTRPHAA